MPRKLFQKEIDEARYQKYKEIEARLNDLAEKGQFGRLSNQVTRQYKLNLAADEMQCSWSTMRRVVGEREKDES